MPQKGCMQYVAKRARTTPGPGDTWDGDCWSIAGTLNVDQFHPRSSDHRPVTQAKLLYDEARLHVLFRVRDRYVRCLHTQYQSSVSRDSCVECFLQPPGQPGYLNFEFNCGGTLLLYFIEDAARGENAPFRKFTPVSPELAATITIWHSLPERVEPEIQHDVEWTLGCSVPFTLFERFTGKLAPMTEAEWRANFFKCGDQTSHPHWASWSPIGEVLRFHQSDRFASLRFDP